MDEPRGFKNLARALAVIGGLLALAWAMRDRLISIPAPREDQPPEFLQHDG